MRERAIPLLYLGAVLLVTSVHHIVFLSAALGVVLLLSGKGFARIAKRTFLAVAAFSSVVTVSYAVLSLIQGSFSSYYVALINLRVFLLTFMTFLLGDRINLFRALSFSRSLTYILTLAYGQVLTFRRLFREFWLALRSRTLDRPSAKQIYAHGAATASFFMEKSINNVAEVTQAMKSRGFFHD